MSWAAVIGGVVSVGGAIMSSKSASKDRRAANNAEQAQLDFAKQQYDDWKAIYGPIEQNLADYYNNITPEYYETVGLEAIEAEYTVVREDLERSMAQRGLTSSALSTAVETDVGIEEAEAKAQVRRDAPRMAAEDKSRFLQIGKGSDPSSSLSNVLSQRSSCMRSRANQSSAAAGDAAANAINVIGTGLSDYFNSKGKM